MTATPVSSSTLVAAPPSQPLVAQTPVNRVDQALATVRDRLDQGWFNDVSHGDLKDINQTLAGLTADERNAVVSGLSDAELNTWTDELDNGGFLGMGEGLSADERRDLHASLGGALDATQLERVYNAYDDRAQKLELAQGVAAHATADVKTEFVGELAAATTENDDLEGVMISDLGDTEGLAVAHVLGSLGGNQTALNDAYGKLSDTQLSSVFEAATQQTMYANMSGGVPTYSYDAGPLASVVDAAATSTNADLKARVFELAGRQMDTVSGANGVLTPTVGTGEAADQIRTSMEGLLKSDVNGVVEALEQDYQAGKGMTAFLQETLGQDGGPETIRGLVDQLARGNDLSGDLLSRFTASTQQDGGVFFPAAERMGYFSGALHQAFEGVNKSAAENVDTLKTIFGFATGKLPGPGVGDATGWLTEQALDTALGEYKSGQADLFESIVDLTTPTAANGRPYDGPAEVSYNEGWESVTRIPLN
ncbi:hypothetical protein [Brevundimonas sp.]|uniref:hypothetical protein n=1 Tax=Brevundimonas sp. TaxID=1871086 RepID=UPI003D097AB4